MNTIAQNTFVALHEDKRISVLYTVSNSVIPDSILSNDQQKIDGYRILVSTTQNRTEAYRLKAKLLSNYSNYQTYISYQTPFFKLKLGDFLSIRKATAVSHQLDRKLKLETTIIPDKIYYSRMEIVK